MLEAMNGVRNEETMDMARAVRRRERSAAGEAGGVITQRIIAEPEGVKPIRF
jgi:hypothetical protein